MPFIVNGTPVSVRSDHPHLLSALRDELNITSPKDGCSPSGQCGCCTVLIDGKAVVPMALMAEWFGRLKALMLKSAIDSRTRSLRAVGCNAVSVSLAL